MTRISRPCPDCFRTIPSDWTSCPWCGNNFYRTKKTVERRMALGNIFWAFVSLAFVFGAFGLVHNRRFVKPEPTIEVKDGTYKHCPLTGEDYGYDINSNLAGRRN